MEIQSLTPQCLISLRTVDYCVYSVVAEELFGFRFGLWEDEPLNVTQGLGHARKMPCRWATALVLISSQPLKTNYKNNGNLTLKSPVTLRLAFIQHMINQYCVLRIKMLGIILELHDFHGSKHEVLCCFCMREEKAEVPPSQCISQYRWGRESMSFLTCREAFFGTNASKFYSVKTVTRCL